MAYAPTTPYLETSSTIDGVGTAHSTKGRPSFRSSQAKNIYRGFSTQGSKGRSFELTDKDLVIRDLLNHIYTVPGERVGRFTYGTLIPLIAFEPATPETITLIEDELRKVVNADPRVELMGMAVMALPDNNVITALLDLKYIELDGMVDTLRLTINQA